jgi:hypothetical protein
MLSLPQQIAKAAKFGKQTQFACTIPGGGVTNANARISSHGFGHHGTRRHGSTCGERTNNYLFVRQRQKKLLSGGY